MLLIWSSFSHWTCLINFFTTKTKACPNSEKDQLKDHLKHAWNITVLTTEKWEVLKIASIKVTTTSYKLAVYEPLKYKFKFITCFTLNCILNENSSAGGSVKVYMVDAWTARSLALPMLVLNAIAHSLKAMPITMHAAAAPLLARMTEL